MSTLGSVISVPSKVMEPLVGVSSRFRHRRKVDLPEPEGPDDNHLFLGVDVFGNVVQDQVVPEGLGEVFNVDHFAAASFPVCPAARRE